MYEPVDVIELLTRDHRNLVRLVEALDAEDRPAEMKAVFEQLIAALAAHEAVEEEIVFPAVRAGLPADDREILGRLDEHAEINQLVAEMRELDSAGFGFLKRACALCVELEEHFAEEEEELFPLLRSVLDLDQLLELGERAQVVHYFLPA